MLFLLAVNCYLLAAVQTLFHQSQLGQEPVATSVHSLPEHSFVRVARRDDYEIVALFEIATEHLHVLEIDRQPLWPPRFQFLADSIEIGEEDSFIRADRPQSIGADIEDALRPELNRFPFAIEKNCS